MEPDFEIPARPKRRYPRGGSVEYDGSVTLRLRPSSDYGDDALQQIVDDVLDEEAYIHGDWFDLPVPVYLVRDCEIGTSFRVSVRYGRVELHVLPRTDVEALERFYEQLKERTFADNVDNDDQDSVDDSADESVDGSADDGRNDEYWETEWYVDR